VNTYTGPVTVIVNDRAYRLMPNETRTIENVPAGPFTFWVLNSQPFPQNRTLTPNEMFVISVFPQV
jgi:hypothetical protein